eukprot:gene2377-3090_t
MDRAADLDDHAVIAHFQRAVVTGLAHALQDRLVPVASRQLLLDDVGEHGQTRLVLLEHLGSLLRRGQLAEHRPHLGCI